MTIIFRKLPFLFTFLFMLSATVQADNIENNDTTHLGHDHPRRLMANNAKSSSVLVEKKYKTILSLIKASTFSGDIAHNENTAGLLITDHKNWRSFRDSQCQLKANVYIYPAYSKMWTSQFHSCQYDMNKQRIEFFNGIRFQYKQ